MHTFIPSVENGKFLSINDIFLHCSEGTVFYPELQDDIENAKSSEDLLAIAKVSVAPHGIELSPYKVCHYWYIVE